MAVLAARTGRSARASATPFLRRPPAPLRRLSAAAAAAPRVFETIGDYRAYRGALPPGASVGLVATMGYLHDGHLALARRTATLSDGELQRVRLAAVSRSGLTGVTVVLDEPTAGLHRRAVADLVTRLHALRDAGNTVVVVDHRPDVLHAADHLI